MVKGRWSRRARGRAASMAHNLGGAERQHPHIYPAPGSSRCPHATRVCSDIVPLLANHLGDRGRGRDPDRRLLRFMLNVEDAETDPADFDYLLEYLADCHVEHVIIDARLGPPNLSFDFQRASNRLLHLSLFGVGVGVGVNEPHRPISQARFINTLPLEVIHIESTSLSDLDLKWILLSCPRLRTLDLRLCRGLTCVDVTAATARLLSLTVAECPQVVKIGVSTALLGLRSFTYSGGVLQSVALPQNCLRDLFICFTTPTISSLVRLHKCLDALPNLSNLVVLTMCSNALMIVSTLRGTGNFQPQLAKLSNLQNLRELQLVMFAMHTEILSYMYGFLRMCRCSRLQSISVELPRDRSYSFMDAVNGWAEEPGMDDFENLVIVKITNFRWQWNEIKLVHFLFRKARSLRKVILVLPKGTTPERDQSGNAIFPELNLLRCFENPPANVKVLVLDERTGANIRVFHRDVFSQQ